ncbi:MAG: histidinol-phosphatase [Treponema sp.]|jgi:histidinol-phosphatase (PHP family)|nr:histidinol-phosphatase [Treponema sp.]
MDYTGSGELKSVLIHVIRGPSLVILKGSNYNAKIPDFEQALSPVLTALVNANSPVYSIVMAKPPEPCLQNRLNLSSLHTHTKFCDGRDDVELMCRAAFEKCLGAIGFSAHAPIGKTGIQSNWHLQDERLGDYIEAVYAARRRWEGKLAVYLGLECDYIKGLRSALDRDIVGLNVDFIIGSVHYIVPPSGEPFTVDGPIQELERGIENSFNGSGEALMHAYWDAVAEMTALGGFDILGHVDLIKKNNQESRWFNIESEAYSRRIAETARSLGQAGLAAEINTGGLNRKRTSDTYPSLAVLRVFRQNHIPILISADAHSAEELDGNYPAAYKTLLKAGYTEHVLFTGRKDGKAVWHTEELYSCGE